MDRPLINPMAGIGVAPAVDTKNPSEKTLTINPMVCIPTPAEMSSTERQEMFHLVQTSKL